MNKKVIIIISVLLIVAIATVSAIFIFKKPEDKKVGIDYLVLVNKQNKVPDDWESKVELETTKNASGKEVQEKIE